ncbi:MAG: hypothetical protein JSS66_03430 [Armatimonadetes bacterium]|nr:hypothetical protein [Armatimonadota bacterium]
MRKETRAYPQGVLWPVLALGLLVMGSQAPSPDAHRDLGYVLSPVSDDGAVARIGRQRSIDRSADLLKQYGNRVDPSHLGRFLKAQALMATPGHNLGLSISDAEYWRRSEPFLRFPALLGSQKFLKALWRVGGWKDAVRLIELSNAERTETQKWKVLAFRSQFIRSVDRTTFDRLLVFVPNQEQPDGTFMDQWIQFALDTSVRLDPSATRSVSMVSVSPGRAYMMDFGRFATADGSIVIRPTALAEESPSKNCFDCHKSAVLPVHPEAVYASSEPGIDQQLNAKIRDYGLWHPDGMDTEAYGPCLGPSDKSRSIRQVKEWAGEFELEEAAARRVADSMRCSQCHQDFAPLNGLVVVPSDRDAQSFRDGRALAQAYVENGWMPPGNKLSNTERRALWRCLQREYFDARTMKGDFVDWLEH